ncbi:cytosolic protein [Bacillus swezeyi]|uniref:Cytosolic protein n=1 Tax=Bacillus swezeyi TaxID=1925020 RepID=A0A1R1QJL1_9BACI|nr:cytosolic protein [Bacillus swezeyi]MEC1262826.1 cytosolic protein [Bacillus swezeyi]MED2928315.1 cytosolic protein [Bacillus swezeyi]MED2944685.1 cytosolic protein [Bacillus swezeyi]MED2966430.1 cytosolic protein [Bacillus swezeyi]MED2975287.1 cytosolic protein [Bacillus swezeyi]
MSIFQKIQGFISTHAETSDRHPLDELKSRYYKATAKQALEAVLEVLEGFDGCTVISVSEERGEISAEIKKTRKAFLVATVVSIGPFDTAVDFNVSTETFLPTDFGCSRSMVSTVYRELDRKLAKAVKPNN